jgi:hypothetical protein
MRNVVPPVPGSEKSGTLLSTATFFPAPPVFVI